MRRYVEDELIPTEHAQLDDNGDGRGTEVQRVPAARIAAARPTPRKAKKKAKEKPSQARAEG